MDRNSRRPGQANFLPQVNSEARRSQGSRTIAKLWATWRCGGLCFMHAKGTSGYLGFFFLRMEPAELGGTNGGLIFFIPRKLSVEPELDGNVWWVYSGMAGTN